MLTSSNYCLKINFADNQPVQTPIIYIHLLPMSAVMHTKYCIQNIEDKKDLFRDFIHKPQNAIFHIKKNPLIKCV